MSDIHACTAYPCQGKIREFKHDYKERRHTSCFCTFYTSTHTSALTCFRVAVVVKRLRSVKVRRGRTKFILVRKSCKSKKAYMKFYSARLMFTRQV